MWGAGIVALCVVQLQLISPHCIRFRVIAMHNSGSSAVQRFSVM